MESLSQPSVAWQQQVSLHGQATSFCFELAECHFIKQMSSSTTLIQVMTCHWAQQGQGVHELSLAGVTRISGEAGMEILIKSRLCIQSKAVMKAATCQAHIVGIDCGSQQRCLLWKPIRSQRDYSFLKLALAYTKTPLWTGSPMSLAVGPIVIS